MKRILTVITLLTSLSFGAGFEMPTYETQLLGVDKGVGVIADNPNLVVGSGGVVMHTFEDGSESIIARAVVTEKTGEKATLRFEVFDQLTQKAFPLPGLLPSTGDKIVLNFLYNRSLIIVPNVEIYNQVTQAFPNIEFIHPDIVGAYLNYEYKPNPTRDDFRKMCAQSAAGLIFIALENEADFLDCQSFKIIKKFQSGTIASYQLPFYTRVKGITTVFWKFDGEKINNYDKYYKALIKDYQDVK